ncbi:MAG: zinc-ribbon domain-containing protein [Myxococcales bacterium]|nr:zinc-ribbon domain-containing protein [Myxococcales bacterium]
MTVTCDHCHKRYVIADDKVRGRSVRIRCKRCQGVISIEGLKAERRAAAAPKAAWEEERTVAMPVLDLSSVWHAMVKGKQLGPLDVKALQAKVRSGEIGLRNYLWRQGMKDWKRAAELPELTRLFIGGDGLPAPAAPAPAAAPPVRAEAPVVRQAEPQPAKAAEPSVTPRAAEEPKATLAKAEGERADPLGELYSDASHPGAERDTLDDEPEERQEAAKETAKKEPEDPFAAMGDIDPAKLGAPGEATRFFIAQAGVNKRNPPWKIALAIATALAAPVGVLYFLSELKIVPLEVTRVDESGNEVTESVFSAGGVSGLKDLLSGKNKKKPEPPTQVAARPKKPEAEPPEASPPVRPPPVRPPPPNAPTQEELAALYNDASKQTTGPRVRKDVEEKTKDTSLGGLSEEAVSQVVAQSQSAFQQCIEQEMRKNPGFKGGKINIVATVGSSGVVKRAEIDRRDIDLSDLGGCLKRRAKQMQFSSFSGDEETEVHIPLILSATM